MGKKFLKEDKKMSIYKPGRPTKYDPARANSEKPPERPGEYRIRDEAGSITYVGETNNLRRRTNEHTRSGKLDCSGTLEYQIADGRSTSQTRRVHEREKIHQHSPTDNKSKGGEGRIAK